MSAVYAEIHDVKENWGEVAQGIVDEFRLPVVRSGSCDGTDWTIAVLSEIPWAVSRFKAYFNVRLLDAGVRFSWS